MESRVCALRYTSSLITSSIIQSLSSHSQCSTQAHKYPPELPGIHAHSPTHSLAHTATFVLLSKRPHTLTVTAPCTNTSCDTRSHSHPHSSKYSQPQSLPQQAVAHHGPVCSDTSRHSRNDTPMLAGSCHPHPSHNPAVIPRDPSLSPHPPPQPHTGRLWRQRAAAATQSRPTAPCPAGAQPACPHTTQPCLPAGVGFPPPSQYLPQFLTSELFRELAGASSINQSPCG